MSSDKDFGGPPANQFARKPNLAMYALAGMKRDALTHAWPSWTLSRMTCDKYGVDCNEYHHIPPTLYCVDATSVRSRRHRWNSCRTSRDKSCWRRWPSWACFLLCLHICFEYFGLMLLLGELLLEPGLVIWFLTTFHVQGNDTNGANFRTPLIVLSMKAADRCLPVELDFCHISKGIDADRICDFGFFKDYPRRW